MKTTPRRKSSPTGKSRQSSPLASSKKETYSTLEAAELLGVAFQTVGRWMDRGFLHGWRTPGGHRLIAADSLNKVLQEGQEKPARKVALPSGRQGLSFLLVDDSEEDLGLLRKAVLDAYPEARIESANNAFEALVAVGRTSPDVLITDILMPGVDGFEMIRNLRESRQTRSVLILAVSTYRAPDLLPSGRTTVNLGGPSI